MRHPFRAWSTLTLLGCVAALAIEAAPVRVFQRETPVLRIRTPTATQIEPPQAGYVSLTVDPDTGAETTLRLRWPESGESRLRLWARDKSPGRDVRQVDLQAELTLPDGKQIRAQRAVRVGDDSTALFEIYRRGRRALILTIDSELIRETVLPGPRASPGAAVLFFVEVQRVLGERVISLERNQLHSFVGEPVRYSFRLGDSPEADSVQLELLPLRVMGDVVEIGVQISGKLPGPEGPQLVSRGEEWLASRGAANTAALETGDPPTGYRFVVTPMF